jgi:hypothetical protein
LPRCWGKRDSRYAQKRFAGKRWNHLQPARVSSRPAPLHHLLTTEMGWPAAQHQQWVTGLLEADLLAGR